MSDAAPSGNGHTRRAPVFDTLDDAAEAVAHLRDEYAFVREQLTDIKTALDLILKAMKIDEEHDEASGG